MFGRLCVGVGDRVERARKIRSEREESVGGEEKSSAKSRATLTTRPPRPPTVLLQKVVDTALKSA